MFSLYDAYEDNITLGEIYTRVPEMELWLYYCPNFKDLDKDFRSPLYDDQRASCRIYYNPKGKLVYKDFGTGDHYDIVAYIQAKYFCTFEEALKIIANDFNLRKTTISINRSANKVDIQERLLIKPKADIEIVTKPFSIVDYEYWMQYGITLMLLNKYNVFSCKTVYFRKDGKETVFDYKYSRHVYAYRFVKEDGGYSYKIYRPYVDKMYKWLFNGTNKDIEGYDQLSETGDILILTKSLKDCMCYRLLGYDAISIQGESNRLDRKLYDILKKRFKQIIINYDNDEQGIISTNKLAKQYNLRYFYIDKYKDLSDFIKYVGLDEAKTMIYNKINECRTK